jgi:polysaccharide export outer membrane protein
MVTGAVEHPGVVPVRAGTRIAELVALGGGPKTKEVDGQSIELADLAAGRVIRDGAALPVSLARAMEGDPRHNVRVRAGDILLVPAARGREVSVLGDVHTSKVVPFVPGMRLSKALAMAGGPTRAADNADVRIVRGSLAAPRVFRASLRALVDGNGTDVVLCPGDVVYVSEHWFASSTEVIQRITPLLVGAAFVGSLK